MSLLRHRERLHVHRLTGILTLGCDLSCGHALLESSCEDGHSAVAQVAGGFRLECAVPLDEKPGPGLCVGNHIDRLQPLPGDVEHGDGGVRSSGLQTRNQGTEAGVNEFEFDAKEPRRHLVELYVEPLLRRSVDVVERRPLEIRC